MKRTVFFLAMALLWAGLGTAWADPTSWIDEDGSWPGGRYDTASNWTLGVPDENTDAIVTTAGSRYTHLFQGGNHVRNLDVSNLYWRIHASDNVAAHTVGLTVHGNFTQSSGRTELNTMHSFVFMGDVNLTGGDLYWGRHNQSNEIGNVTVHGTTTIAENRSADIQRLASWATVNLGNLVLTGGTLNMVHSTGGTNGAPNGTTTEVTVNRLHGGSGTVRGGRSGATLTTTGRLIVDGTVDGTFGGLIENGGTNNVVEIYKRGTSTLTLEGENTYSGVTRIEGGTVVASHNSALGSGEVRLAGGDAVGLRIAAGVTVANEIAFDNTHAGSAVERVMGNDDAFSTGTTGALLSAFDEGIPTTAAFLAGTNSAAETTLQMRFSETSGAVNDEERASDVFLLNGTGDDLFVLQLGVDGAGASTYLGWMDGDDTWVLATDGNTGNNATGGQLGFAGSFASFQGAYGTTLSNYIGAYGNDGDGNVWAVLNHNSSFAVIPEPHTIGLLLSAAALLALRRRRG